MPEIDQVELDRLRQIESQSLLADVQVAKANLRADHPHLPAALIEGFQGGVEDVKRFGAELLKSFPATQLQPPTPPQQAEPAAPPASQPQVPVPNPAAPGAAPVDPRETFAQAALGNPSPQLVPTSPYTPPQLARPVPPGQAALPVPSPGMGEAVTAASAWQAQQDVIRMKMASGIATPAEVLQLSQYGDRGFTAAMTNHAQKVRSAVGAR